MLSFRVISGLLLLPIAFACGTAGQPVFASVAGYEDWAAIHRQMGATGKNGYRPMTSRAYQSSARFHTRALNAYGSVCKEVPVETAQEHLNQVKSAVAAVKKEISKIDTETAQKAGIQENVAKIKSQLAECEKMCSMADKAISGEKVDSKTVCAHCVSLEKQLAEIRKEEDAMLKKLGIALPEEDAIHEHESKK
ncbi:MAG: hypothetical protein JNL58_20650 [Planctomyces sp.]|nr:hypothetical protein [Planctomyces sp.]